MDRLTPNEKRTRVAEASNRRFGSWWLYGFAGLPVVTDLIETGRWPLAPREWITEVAAAALIVWLVRKFRSEHLALLRQARSDPLTGLGNRRAFADALQSECVRSRRQRQPLCLVCIDLDHFKLVNDQAGHDAGDRVLQQLADSLRQVARAHVDRGFRLGGDEFAVLLPGGSTQQAQAVVARVLDFCAQLDPLWTRGPLGMSTGIVEYDGQESPEALLQRADQAMYLTKRARRADQAPPMKRVSHQLNSTSRRAAPVSSP